MGHLHAVEERRRGTMAPAAKKTKEEKKKQQPSKGATGAAGSKKGAAAAAKAGAGAGPGGGKKKGAAAAAASGKGGKGKQAAAAASSKGAAKGAKGKGKQPAKKPAAAKKKQAAPAPPVELTPRLSLAAATGPDAPARVALASCPELPAVGLFLWAHRGTLKLGGLDGGGRPADFTLSLSDLEAALLSPHDSPLLAQITSRLLLRPQQLKRLAQCKPHQGVLSFPQWATRIRRRVWELYERLRIVRAILLEREEAMEEGEEDDESDNDDDEEEEEAMDVSSDNEEDLKLPPTQQDEGMGEFERQVRAEFHAGVEDEAVEGEEERLEVLLRYLSPGLEHDKITRLRCPLHIPPLGYPPENENDGSDDEESEGSEGSSSSHNNTGTVIDVNGHDEDGEGGKTTAPPSFSPSSAASAASSEGGSSHNNHSSGSSHQGTEGGQVVTLATALDLSRPAAVAATAAVTGAGEGKKKKGWMTRGEWEAREAARKEQEEAEACSAYLALDPIQRVYVLLALCEEAMEGEGILSAMGAIESEDLRGTALGQDARGRAYLTFPQFYDDCRVFRTMLPSAFSSSAASAASIRKKKKGKGKEEEQATAPATPPPLTRTDLKPHNDMMGDVDETMELVADSPEALRHLVGLGRQSRKRADRELADTLEELAEGVEESLAAAAARAEAKARADEKRKVYEAMPRRRSSRVVEKEVRAIEEGGASLGGIEEGEGDEDETSVGLWA